MDGKVGAVGRLRPMLLPKLELPWVLCFVGLSQASDVASESTKGFTIVESFLVADFLAIDILDVIRANIVGLVAFGGSACESSLNQSGCELSEAIPKAKMSTLQEFFKCLALKLIIRSKGKLC